MTNISDICKECGHEYGTHSVDGDHCPKHDGQLVNGQLEFFASHFEPKDEAVTVSKSVLLQLERTMQELRKENAALKNPATYEQNYAIRMLKYAIDFSETEGDFTHARTWANSVGSIIAELEAEIANLNEGAKIMHSVAMKGEQSVLSRLDGDADLQDLIRWQDESEATRKSDYPR